MNDTSLTDLTTQAQNGTWDDTTLANKAVELAEHILRLSNQGMRWSEKKQARQMARMMNDPAGKAFTITMADRIFRPSAPEKAAEEFRYLLDGYGVPHYLSKPEQLAMSIAKKASEFFPGLVIPSVKGEIRNQSRTVILPSEDGKLNAHIKRRKKDGIRLNINQLGEAVLGETEAHHRLQQIVELLCNPLCNYISVKLSSVYSQISLLNREETIKQLQDRLRVLFRTAIEHGIPGSNGHKKPKFVNLDMEEYRDLHLTCEAFKRTLMEEEFMNLEAGIVLQAYLPDSWEEQKKLCDWTKERVQAGGARIKIRIVKGANLAMEQAEASIHGWPQAPYESKEMTDANYKRMLHYGCQKEHAQYVRLGIASHNIFDLSYAILLREQNGVRESVELEMLEGMANQQARILINIAGDLLLYAPVVRKQDFPNAISYLVRRLDENTGEENFLHDVFGMTPGSQEWENQKKRFLKACASYEKVKYGPNRKQNRALDAPLPFAPGDDFFNEPDTDWALPHHQDWLLHWLEEEKKTAPSEIPLVIDGQECTSHLWGVGRNPSDADNEFYKFAYADYDLVEKAVTVAQNAQASWASTPVEERQAILCRTAEEISNMRGLAIAAMTRDAGKAPFEGDVEVSEAIDFCRYYAEGLTQPGMTDGLTQKPLGTVCITAPWNFPFAIPTGSVAAALMAGNTVIFKPAPQSVYTAFLIAQAFWKAGVPKNVLQFVPAPPNEIGQKLVTHPDISCVMLTGSYATGRKFKTWRPDLHLLAETSGKNAIIITATADLDLAVKDLVKSAFGHSGQKCSAASLAIIEASVYDNPAFLRQLRDAAASLKVGPSTEPDSIVIPVIREPEGHLLRALTELEPGEEWLLKPERVRDNPNLWTPGIRIGVKPGSWFHRTECFGPVLGLIRAESLEEAILIQNDSNFGLTGGIHSLDEREIAEWKSKIQVGNSYINRPITGAIVRRQSFGGWKNSCMGPGAKTGGPNYLVALGTWEENELPQHLSTPGERIANLVEKLCRDLPDDAKRIRAAAGSQAKWWNEEFGIEHDPSKIQGEDNIFRYIPEKSLVVRMKEDATNCDIALLILAAKLTGVATELSMDQKRSWISGYGDHNVTVIEESEETLRSRIPAIAKNTRILRSPACPVALRKAAEDAGMTVLDMPVLANGRLELLNWFHEQAISETIHRYGNIVPRPGTL
jgi:RHH-type proline utilization regulon transcriptional repressor/proline dehydrogenase/delta 1-pyrroline-5-carboxylate dehydrogenase